MTLILPRPLGTLPIWPPGFTPWRPAFGVHATESGLTFYVHHRRHDRPPHRKYGTHEPLVTRWLADYLGGGKSGASPSDIGANLGWHAVHADASAISRRWWRSNPDPFNAWLLERNSRPPMA